jgi:hypothetical protein
MSVRYDRVQNELSERLRALGSPGELLESIASTVEEKKLEEQQQEEEAEKARTGKRKASNSRVRRCRAAANSRHQHSRTRTATAGVAMVEILCMVVAFATSALTETSRQTWSRSAFVVCELRLARRAAHASGRR